MKQRIRLTESDLHRIIKESVKKVLNEVGYTDKYYKLGGGYDGYYSAAAHHSKDEEEQKKFRKQAMRGYYLDNKLHKHNNNGQLYDPHSKESAENYRKKSNAYTTAFDQGWSRYEKEHGIR